MKLKSFLITFIIIALVTILGIGFRSVLQPIDLVMIYLLGGVLVASTIGKWESLTYSLLSVACFNFFFVPPIYNFNIYDRSYIITFCVMLITSMAISRSHDIAVSSKLKIEQEKLKNTLLSSISHDLRTPLSSIRGAASIITIDIDKIDKETILELANSINHEAQRLSKIITNLLEVTKLESGNLTLNLQEYFIEEIIGSALSQLESLLHSHQVITVSEDNIPTVMVDPLLIEQVIINILENAAKYTSPVSIITIEVRKIDNYILVSISDNGPGIIEQDLEKIFDKFFTSNINTQNKGTGLGLAICLSIISAHQGKIWAERSSSGGAQFNFTLPISLKNRK